MSLKLPRNWDFSTFKAETARIGKLVEMLRSLTGRGGCNSSSLHFWEFYMGHVYWQSFSVKHDSLGKGGGYRHRTECIFISHLHAIFISQQTHRSYFIKERSTDPASFLCGFWVLVVEYNQSCFSTAQITGVWQRIQCYIPMKLKSYKRFQSASFEWL